MTPTAETPTPKRVDLNRATSVGPEESDLITDMFEYHSWTTEMVAHGTAVRQALIAAVKTIVLHVPPGPDRSVAIRKIREARMDCNSAITHGGKY